MTAKAAWRSFGGAEDFVSLTKELVALHKKPEYEKFTAKGGVMEGERLTPEKVTEVSKWPNRAGQISILLGQILSPARRCCRRSPDRAASC